MKLYNVYLLQMNKYGRYLILNVKKDVKVIFVKKYIFAINII